MLAWRESRRGRGTTGLDKASIYRLWKEFDRSRRRDGDAGDPPPPFGEVVGLLHARCYDEAVVVAELSGDSTDPARTDGVAERVGCARRWLAGPGRGHCWIERPVEGDAVDTGAVQALLADDGLTGAVAPEQRRALFMAAFGAGGGPPLRAIVDRFGVPVVRQALRQHLVDGSHPLREAVLAALDRGGFVERSPDELLAAA
ncbi:MAG: hypothetical protein ABR521_08940 [Gaiellaceae bacterium]